MGQGGGLSRDIACCGVSIWKGFLEDIDLSRKSFFWARWERGVLHSLWALSS